MDIGIIVEIVIVNETGTGSTPQKEGSIKYYADR